MFYKLSFIANEHLKVYKGIGLQVTKSKPLCKKKSMCDVFFSKK
jgi:hypothetical protein